MPYSYVWILIFIEIQTIKGHSGGLSGVCMFSPCLGGFLPAVFVLKHTDLVVLAQC